MSRPKFTHELAGSSGPPQWVRDPDTVLEVQRPDGKVEVWDYYLELDENGEMWPALPPSARNEKASIAEKARANAGGSN
jgi:hypothetical protein